MGNLAILDAKAEENKKKMFSVMECLEGFSSHGDVPRPDACFASAKQLLQKTEFNVIVCGEIKQGKSSFINSLVGRDILPTDVDVATCQVCMLYDSGDGGTECALVFENEERSAIDESKVEDYGKERGLNISRDPLVAGRTLAYIEIKLPAKFLPHGVRLIDTPGLGALNPQHAVIAERWITLADAVVFVSDVSRPLTKSEVDELVRVYTKIPNVLIVQTKADVVSEDIAAKIIDDNKAKIAKALTEAGLKREVLIASFSARLLSKCGKQNDINSDKANILRSESKVDDVLSALRHLFLQTVCYYTLIASYEQAALYYKALQTEVLKRKNELTATDEERKKLRKEAEEKIVQFNRVWGKEGSKVKEVNGFLSRLGNIVHQRLQFDLGSGVQSQIYTEFCKSIDTIDNSEQISDYQENLHFWVNSAICDVLKRINQAIALEYNKQLAEYAGMIREGDVAIPQIERDFNDISLPKLGFFEKARNVMLGVTTGCFIAKGIDVAAVLLAPVTGGASLAFIPIAEGSVIATGAYRGLKVSTNTALDRQRAKLKEEVLKDVARHWKELKQPTAFGEMSKFEQWIFESAKRFSDTLNAVVSEKRLLLRQDVDRIKKLEAKLLDAQKELTKIIAIEGCENLDGTRTGLLSVKCEMKAIRDFIEYKARENKE